MDVVAKNPGTMPCMLSLKTLLPAALIIFSAIPLCADARVEKNVIYGMHSGLALLMDIHYPENPNGYGVIHVSGSGWTAPLSLDARPLKESSHVRIEGAAVVEAGYTLFTVNHRALPRYRYKDIVADVQRAVRFIRFHADKYGISPQKIGALGGSSGGHLVSMLGVLDGTGDKDDESDINRLSAKVQAVVARATPADPGSMSSATTGLLLGARVRDGMNPQSQEMRLARDASPLSHATSDDPPFLLIHGDADDVVPFHQSEILRDALAKANVTVELVSIPGARHGPSMPGALEPPRIGIRAAEWFDVHLQGK